MDKVALSSRFNTPVFSISHNDTKIKALCKIGLQPYLFGTSLKEENRHVPIRNHRRKGKCGGIKPPVNGFCNPNAGQESRKCPASDLSLRTSPLQPVINSISLFISCNGQRFHHNVVCASIRPGIKIYPLPSMIETLAVLGVAIG